MVRLRTYSFRPVAHTIVFSPHCDNHYVIEAKEPELAVGIEADDPRMNGRFMKDDRLKTAGSMFGAGAAPM